jgi:hypothetical protein
VWGQQRDQVDEPARDIAGVESFGFAKSQLKRLVYTRESRNLPEQWLHDILNSMTTPQLRSMLQAAPFRPFEIYMADGRALSVPHPEMVAITSGGRTIGVATSDDTIEIVDLLLVTSLKPHANGASK